MYQTSAIHSLGPPRPFDATVEAALWGLFLHVGIFWRLEDDPATYRLRFSAFLDNRVALNPLYRNYYEIAATLLGELIAERGPDEAYRIVFTQRGRAPPGGPPVSPLDVTQRYVADELIAFRLALGGFKSFGGINYCGYFGGANVDGEKVPYRPMDG